MRAALPSFFWLFALGFSFLQLACTKASPPAAPASQGEEVLSLDAQEPRTTPKEESVSVERGTVLELIAKRGRLRVGMTGEQAPFNMKSQSGEFFGLEVDLANSLSRSMGVELEIVQKPFGQLLAAVESGEVDLAMSSITMTPRRNVNVAFVGPYYVSGKALLTKNETLVGSENGAVLNKAGLRLAAIRGSTSEAFVRKMAPEAQLTSVVTYDEGAKTVASGRVDAFVADLPQVAVLLLRNPGVGFAPLGDAMSFEPIGIALPPGDAHFVNLVDNYMHLLDGTGTLEALMTHWFGSVDWIKELPPSTVAKPLDPSARFEL